MNDKEKSRSGRGLVVSGIVLVIVLAIVLVLFVLPTDRFNTNEQGGGQASLGPIIIGVPNWASGKGTAYILQAMIEKNFDVETRLQNGVNEELYAGIANGTVHIHPQGWTPNHTEWHTQFADALARNRNSIDATQGLCVDRSLANQYGITAIEDLSDPGKTHYFDSDSDGQGEMWIGAKGWGSLPVEQIRAKSYGYYDFFDLLILDESLALQRFDEAVAAEKLFVISCYTPHWIWAAYDLYQLKEPSHDPDRWQVVSSSEDPQWLEKSNAAVAWESAKLHTYYARTLEQEYPEIAQFLQNTYFTMDELQAITYDIKFKTNNQDIAAYAEQWVMLHR